MFTGLHPSYLPLLVGILDPAVAMTEHDVFIWCLFHHLSETAAGQTGRAQMIEGQTWQMMVQLLAAVQMMALRGRKALGC